MSSRAISGFPELLPEDRLVETFVENRLREVFELHGFVGIETRAVEPLAALESKGETSKEVYLLERLQSARTLRSGDRGLDKNTLGLHFDLTVPLARYVLSNSNSLIFPFKRYQIQKVWRGERPQEGRFREFTQADIDIVGQGNLDFHHEVEAAEVMLSALNSLGIGQPLMEVNNRKLLQGIFTAVGIEDFDESLRALDKLDKIGVDGVAKILSENGLTTHQIEVVTGAAAITAGSSAELRERVGAFGLQSEALEVGLQELGELVDQAALFAPGQVRASLRIARGLDYYTGTVYETVLPGYESFGSICSGGRYDKLASDGKRVFPGVGLSVGVTRLVSLILGAGLLKASRSTPSAVMVIVNDEDSRDASEEVARTLRNRGIAAEVSPSSQKYGKQIRYADRKGIPFVWFVEAGAHSVKNLATGDQQEAAPLTWDPPNDCLKPQFDRTS